MFNKLELSNIRIYWNLFGVYHINWLSTDVNAFKIVLKTYYFKLAFKGSKVDYDDIELM